MARKKRTSLEPEAEPTLDASTQAGAVTAEATVSGTSDEFSTEDAPPVDGAAKFKAARELRQKCVELLSARRENGEPLSDIAIASRLKVSPAYVAGVRAAHKADAPGQTIIPIPEQTQTAAEVAHEEARENFDLPPTAEEEETLERVEQTYATDDPTRLTRCTNCGYGDQRIGSYCKACSRYVPLPDAGEKESEPDPGTPAVVTAPEMMEPVATDRAVPVPPVEAINEQLKRQEMQGRDYMLSMLAGWENSSRRFPDLIALADAITDIRRFAEARLDGASTPELQRLDDAAKTRGLLLQLWSWSDAALAHPQTRRLATFVRAMLQAEDHLQAEGK